MDYKKLVAGISLGLIVAIGINFWVSNLNESYSSFGAASMINATQFYNQTGLDDIDAYAAEKALTTGDLLDPDEIKDGADEGVLTQMRSAVSAVKDMMGFVPKMIDNTAQVFGIPAPIRNLAKYAFIFAFSFTAILLIFAGIRRFT